MEIAELTYIIKQRLVAIILIAIIGMSTTAYVVANQAPSYQASLIITIQAKRENVDQYQYGGFYAIQSSELFVNTIIGWLKSENIISAIYTKAHIEIAAENISKYGKNIYSRKVPPQNISLIISDTDPDRAQTLSESTIAVIQERTRAINSVADSSANFEVITTPSVVVMTEKNTALKTVAVGFVLIILSTIITLLLEFLSKRINTPHLAKRIFGTHVVKIRTRLLKKNTKKLREKALFALSFFDQEKSSTCALVDTETGEKAVRFAGSIAQAYKKQKSKTAIIDLTGSAQPLYTNEQFTLTEMPEKNQVTKSIHSEKGVQVFVIKNTDEETEYSPDEIEASITEIAKHFDHVLVVFPPLTRDSRFTQVAQSCDNMLPIIGLRKTLLADALYLSEFIRSRSISAVTITLT